MSRAWGTCRTPWSEWTHISGVLEGKERRQKKNIWRNNGWRSFPKGPVVKRLCASTAGGTGSIPGRGSSCIMHSVAKKRKNRKNGWKHFKSGKRNECSYPRNSTNSKQNELKEIHTETQYSASVKTKRQNLKSKRREVICHIPGTLKRLQLVSYQKLWRPKGSGMIYLKA